MTPEVVIVRLPGGEELCCLVTRALADLLPEVGPASGLAAFEARDDRRVIAANVTEARARAIAKGRVVVAVVGP